MGIYMLLNIISTLLSIYGYLLIATAIMSWIPDLASTQIGRILHNVTDPYLRIFRRFIPPVPLGGIMLDVAFIVAIIVYFFIERGIMAVLVGVLAKVVS